MFMNLNLNLESKNISFKNVSFYTANKKLRLSKHKLLSTEI